MTIALIVVQEMAARMGAVTGKGLVRSDSRGVWAPRDIFHDAGSGHRGLLQIVSEFAGLASGMGIFGVSKYIVVPIGAAF